MSSTPRNRCAIAHCAGGLIASAVARGESFAATEHFALFQVTFDIYVIGVFVAWILLFVIGYYFYGPTRGHPALQVFGGFLPGMVAMYIATHVYGMP
jgi:hypothetical protein